MTNEEYLEYLKKTDFEKQLAKLETKLKNTEVILYGAGEFLEAIKHFFNLSGLNVVGICDRRFYEEQEGSLFCGYKIIPYSKLKDSNTKTILVCTLKYINIIDNLEKLFAGKKIKIEPLVKKSFLSEIKEIFG